MSSPLNSPPLQHQPLSIRCKRPPSTNKRLIFIDCIMARMSSADFGGLLEKGGPLRADSKRIQWTAIRSMKRKFQLPSSDSPLLILGGQEEVRNAVGGHVREGSLRRRPGPAGQDPLAGARWTDLRSPLWTACEYRQSY